MKRTTVIVLATVFAGLLLTAVVLFVLVPSLTGLSFPGFKPGPIRHGVSFLLTVETNLLTGAPADEKDMQRVQKSISRRADRLGVRSEVHVEGKTVRVVLPFTTDEAVKRARASLTRRGLLEFRLVHEENAKLLQEGIIPAGYAMMKETRMNADGTKAVVPFLVSRRPVKGFSGGNIVRAALARGNMNDPRIAFRFDPEGTAVFARITTENVGKQLAIVVDGELLSAPMIRTPITEGSGEISGGSMTEQEADILAALLESPLENVVEIMEERRF